MTHNKHEQTNINERGTALYLSKLHGVDTSSDIGCYMDRGFVETRASSQMGVDAACTDTGEQTTAAEIHDGNRAEAVMWTTGETRVAREETINGGDAGSVGRR